ncbi:MAG: 2Fe-2S iron-sulfur cluster-binding protein [Lautropia sp.]
MSQKLSVSRAARLLGVSRATLQRLIRSGALPVADGWLATDDLLRVFPDLSLEEGGLFEKVRDIREHAFGKRIREHVLPTSEVLAQRLFVQSQELSELRSHLQAYHRLVVDALALAPGRAAQDADAASPLRAFLESGLARVLGSAAPNRLDAMSDMIKVVSASVRVRPSGRDFIVEGNDSILQAGLKAGLGFAYGCGGGNCGLCKARLVSGTVRQTMHADYRLSDAERAQGHLLMCANMPLTDIVVETLEAAGPADIPHQSIAAKVKSIDALGADTLLVHLQTPRSSRLRFLAGQGVRLALDAEGATAGTYPIASCPCDDRNLLFHLGRDPDDAFACRLFDGAVTRGDAVAVEGPVGDFVLPATVERPLVFIAGDLGFAPIGSLIEHAIAIEADDSIRLYWAAARADRHYLDRQCRAWADAFDGLRYTPSVAPTPLAGALALLDTLVAERDRLADAALYVAGPAAFLEPFAGARDDGRLVAAEWHLHSC